MHSRRVIIPGKVIPIRENTRVRIIDGDTFRSKVSGHLAAFSKISILRVGYTLRNIKSDSIHENRMKLCKKIL